jgi:lipopolysaccharide/colanic/teichoic acid biosynthesis glycosyltransferase
MFFAIFASVRLPVEFNFNDVDNETEAVEEDTFVEEDEEDFRQHRKNVKRLFLNLVSFSVLSCFCLSPYLILPNLICVGVCFAFFRPKRTGTVR